MRRIFLGLVLLGVIGMLIFPYAKLVVPKWEIKVLDKSGNAVPGIKVNQTWEGVGAPKVEEQITNKEGVVSFDERRERLPLVVILVSEATKILPIRDVQSKNYSYAISEIGGGSVYFEEGSTMKHEMVINR